MGSYTAAAGALVGGVEILLLAMRTRLLLDAGDLLRLAGLAVLSNTVLCGLFGLGTGLIIPPLLRRAPRWKRYNAAFTGAIIAYSLVFLLPWARQVWRLDQPLTAVVMAVVVPVIFSVTLWYNAGYWLRRWLVGAEPRLGLRAVGGLGAVALTGLSLVAPSGHGPASPPEAGSPNVILITIDTLRQDHLGIYGSPAATPVMDKLGTEGAIFDNAITPLPETAPSHASMLTGLHPLEHRLTSNGHTLASGYLSIVEQFSAVGYHTGAFVSSFAVDSSTGLDQGFDVYDDDFFPTLKGLSELHVAGVALKVLMRLGDPTDFPFLLERPAPITHDAVLDWVGRTEGPFFLWVHLFEPHSPYERHDGVPAPVDHREILKLEPGYPYTPEESAALRELYRVEVEYTDTQIGALLDGLRAAGALDNARVVLTADHGESLGEHNIYFNHHGIYDTVLRVPLLLWSSAPTWKPGVRISRQVTVMDIANTLLEVSGQPKLVGSRSVPLASVAGGAEMEAERIALLGRMEASLSAGLLFGVRDPNGAKYIQGEDQEELYNLPSDPAELSNIAASQPQAVEAGRAYVTYLKSRGEPEKAEVDQSTNEMLKALGYQE